MKASISHLAIIPDGNRRYAKKVRINAWEGHRLGIEKMKQIATAAFRDFGIPVFTIYAFSSKNFQRPALEVKGLMRLFVSTFEELSDNPEIHKHEVRIRAIGNLVLLPPVVRAAIKKAEAKTAKYRKFSLNLAVAYDGRQEILDAARRLKGKRLTEENLTKATWFGQFPPPDLIIRTSGEQRLSGFLLWGSTYSEFFFSKKLWPEFQVSDLRRAILDYTNRKRRFGT